MTNTPSDKILARLKGLHTRMREGEQPLFSIPAIWENATDHQTKACDLVLTNQRLFGYIYTTFPRERLFLDALELKAITAVSVRKKSFEAMFRELLVSDHHKRIYIRATSKKIEETYIALRAAIAENAPGAGAVLAANRSVPEQEGAAEESVGGADAEQAEPLEQQASQQSEQRQVGRGPIYNRQEIRQPLERSPLGITLLLVGGLILEIVGVLAWISFGSPQVGGSLILTGLLAVIVATIARRQLR